ncbi:MFS transporter [Glutamicibacter uratoxydans]|uniref:MFS transporter n=1 Tax=Glutamicibacter uratoxydans TaxID=43667 RepID=UPI003D6FEA79
MSLKMQQRRRALCLLFFLPGMGLSSWVTRTPDIRDLIEASPAQMGMVLFGLSVGSMLGILASGRLVARFGARSVIAAGASLLILGLPTVAIGALLGQGVVVSAGLFCFGAGMGSAEVAMNVEGADVERSTGRPFLSQLHGFFSLGTVVGASSGIAFTALGIGVPWHLALICLVAIACVSFAIRALPAATGRQDNVSKQQGVERAKSLWFDPSLLLIGVLVLAMALSEGAATDWLPLVMVDGHGFDATSGSLIFTGFALAMTIGRFAGGWFVLRFGRARVFASCAVLGALGMGTVIFAENAILAGSAAILWGLGTSLAFPLAISAAGDSGANAAGRVSVVATMGYVAFLVGPPLLGFIAEVHGLRGALILPLILVVVAAVLSPSIAERAHRRIEIDPGPPHAA